jgi:hypothetical protein
MKSAGPTRPQWFLSLFVSKVAVSLYGAIILSELILTIYLWSDGSAGLRWPAAAAADLCAMLSVLLVVPVAAICLFTAVVAAWTRRWSAVRLVLLLAVATVASVRGSGVAIRAVQRAGCTRIVRRAEPIFEAIREFERTQRKPGTFDDLNETGVRGIASPGVRGAGEFEFLWSAVGAWEISVRVPMHSCSYAVLARTQGLTPQGEPWVEGWNLLCN